jgi:hypothetical protein
MLEVQTKVSGPVAKHLSERLGPWLALFATLASCGLGCTYSGGNRPGTKAQMSTADPYTYEFEKRIPPGGD